MSEPLALARAAEAQLSAEIEALSQRSNALRGARRWC
jgi:hypothetical protein